MCVSHNEPREKSVTFCSITIRLLFRVQATINKIMRLTSNRYFSQVCLLDGVFTAVPRQDRPRGTGAVARRALQSLLRDRRDRRGHHHGDRHQCQRGE